MKSKKVLEFLLLRSALSMKNFSSLGLVALFFGAYVFLGGEGVSIPRVGPGDIQSVEPVLQGDGLEAASAPVSRGRLEGSPSVISNRSAEPRTGVVSSPRLSGSDRALSSTPSTTTAQPSPNGSARESKGDQWDLLNERLKKLKEAQENQEDPTQRSEADSQKNAISE